MGLQRGGGAATEGSDRAKRLRKKLTKRHGKAKALSILAQKLGRTVFVFSQPVTQVGSMEDMASREIVISHLERVPDEALDEILDFPRC